MSSTVDSLLRNLAVLLCPSRNCITLYMSFHKKFIVLKYHSQGNVTIVDTPGIGDDDQENVARRMLDYLQNALAVVFVINVANAGGVQNDRVCQCCNCHSVSLDMLYTIHKYNLNC